MDNAQAMLDQLCKERRIPGATFGFVRDGDVTIAASGIANLNTGLPVVRETLFQAGSIGKSYTATAVMQLVDDGALSLDAPLRDYLPDLEFADAEVSKTLTARQILTHIAGIDGDRLDDEMAYGRGDDVLGRFVAGLRDLPLITAPGGLWSYCNSGYIVLGRLIEVLTGMTYEDALTKRLLEPIGATNTLFFPGDMVTHSLAVGHVKQGDDEPAVAPKWEMSRASGPAGGTINTTMDDLLAFAQMHLRGGLGPDGTRVLSEESVRAMQQPLVACPEPELLGDHWGLGWFIRSGNGPTVFGHDGNTYGLTSCLRIVPERNAAYGLLMNLASQNWAATDIGQQLDPILGTVTPSRPVPSGGTPDDVSAYVGAYSSAGGVLTVAERDGGLAVTLAPTGGETPPIEGELLHLAGDRFMLRIAALGEDMPLTFIKDGDDHYLHMGARLRRRDARR